LKYRFDSDYGSRSCAHCVSQSDINQWYVMCVQGTTLNAQDKQHWYLKRFPKYDMSSDFDCFGSGEKCNVKHLNYISNKMLYNNMLASMNYNSYKIFFDGRNKI